MNKDYRDYRMEDFLADEYFIRWVKFPDAAANAFWQQLSADVPEKAPLIREAREVVYALSTPVLVKNDPAREKIWQAVLDNIQQTPVRPLRRYRRLWLAAASVLLLLALGATWYFTSSITVSTGYGETREVILPDHSTVMLNAHSTATYARSWPVTGKREVMLDGEAFFDVKHTGDTFRVQAGPARVTVLGTAFNVRHRQDMIAVVLQRGLVRIDMPDGEAVPAFLQPGEGWSYSHQQPPVVMQAVDTSAATAWTRHELLLNATKVKEVIHLLKDNYGYTVILEDSTIGEREIKGRIPMQREKDLLFVLSRILDVDIQQKNDTLLFTTK
ncbi:ferric-dicitrate binding protein FerR, regulates iron transport through sigma-19 [Chitinophaga eiseniae]|uniref:Ferric-dicitrate binding protein FerR, regulates iron transport through sigma-19 n=2 Tax=Chitinophaga eiseniae TaxID=634771 RepID=A0A1T4T7A0_9BACT|nr:ferric-dicitrate binding protein FerR, regulates iron transport through sigma-19 [Chitinophaga eiseniae]